MMAGSAKRQDQVNFNIGRDRLAKVNDYRHRHQFATRTEALNFLLDFALKADPPRPDA